MGIYMVKTARHVHTRTKNSSSHKCMYLTLFFPDVITMKS